MRLGLSNKQVQETFIAGLLHEIGKVGFDDELMRTPVVMMNTRQLGVFRKHPTLASQMLMPLDELKASADMIGSQLECFDGDGYPYQLAAQKIPIGARIIVAACDYDSLQIGVLGQRQLDAAEAQAALVRGSGRRYDPVVVQAMLALLGDRTDAVSNSGVDKPAEMRVKVHDLMAGMVLSRDLMTSHGLLMLTAGHVLDEPVICRISDFEKTIGMKLIADVWRPDPA
jgi:HD-GYP domain-containing protein (c-di-GMP phosphodiesterase class II)